MVQTSSHKMKDDNYIEMKASFLSIIGSIMSKANQSIEESSIISLKEPIFHIFLQLYMTRENMLRILPLKFSYAK